MKKEDTKYIIFIIIIYLFIFLIFKLNFDMMKKQKREKRKINKERKKAIKENCSFQEISYEVILTTCATSSFLFLETSN